MIRINLADNLQLERHRQPTANSEERSGARPLGLLLLLAAILNGAYFYSLQQEQLLLAQQALVEQKHNQELAAIRARFLVRQKQAAEYALRVQMIDQLRAAQSGPVPLLTLMGETISQTPIVWLNTVRDNGSGVDIEGAALAPEAVADLMLNLQKTGYFRSVEIKESYQDETHKGQRWFLFTLQCQRTRS